MKEILRTEIGSEFWDVPLAEHPNGCFANGTKWFLSGRSALEAIVEEIKSRRKVRIARLPSYCCDSMILPFLKHGLEVRFYPVFIEDGRLIQEVADAEQDEILFLIDYFGYTSAESVRRTDAVVIRDVTHSVFSHSYSDADYYFGSLRKWCGFKTGGFAFGLEKSFLKTDYTYVSLRESAMREKNAYIQGQSESKDFLEAFAQAEEYLEGCAPSGADEGDIARALHTDVAFLKSRRRKNASVLLQGLRDISIFKTIKENDCPLFVPIAVEGHRRDALRRYLIERQMYMPVHWPISDVHCLNDKTAELYERELSLVCDQRYGEEDMLRIIEAVNQFLKR